MSDWINYTAVAKILVFGLIVGAGLPALFALGVRLHSAGSQTRGRHLLPVALSWVAFGLVVLAVTVGVLFIARDFIAAHTGWYILGAERT